MAAWDAWVGWDGVVLTYGNKILWSTHGKQRSKDVQCSIDMLMSYTMCTLIDLSFSTTSDAPHHQFFLKAWSPS